MANHHLSQELSLACGFWFLFHPRESYLGSFSSRPHPLSMGTGRGPAPRWPCSNPPPTPAPIKNPILTPPSFPRPKRISRSRFPKPLPPPDCLSVSLVPPPPSLAVTALPHTTTTLLPAYFASVPSSAGCISNWRYPAAPCTAPPSRLLTPLVLPASHSSFGAGLHPRCGAIPSASHPQCCSHLSSPSVSHPTFQLGRFLLLADTETDLSSVVFHSASSTRHMLAQGPAPLRFLLPM